MGEASFARDGAGVGLLVCLLVGTDDGQGSLENDLDVEPEGPVLQIPDVALDAFLHLPELLGLTTTACHLGPSGDAGTTEMAHHILIDEGTVLLGVQQHMRTRSYNAHVALQHIEELWELVDIGLAHELPKRELARVVLRGLQHVGLFVDVHGTELITIEIASVQSGALLHKEKGARALQLDDECYDGQEGDEHQAGKQTHDDVEGTL